MPYVTSEGANLFVDLAGAGRPVLFVHGLGMHHAQWDPQWAAITAECQAFRVDLRGHGRSATTPHGYTYAAMARDLQRILAQVGIDRHNPGFVVGHSISADAVLQVALAEPRALRGVVVVTPAVWGQRWSEDWLALWLGMRAEARAGRVPAAFERFRADRIFDGVRARPELLERVRAMHAACSGAHWLDDEPNEGPATLDRLPECKVPLLVLSAAGDREDFRIAARAIAESVPETALHEFADSAHFPNLEVPAAFDAVLLEFIREHS